MMWKGEWFSLDRIYNLTSLSKAFSRISLLAFVGGPQTFFTMLLQNCKHRRCRSEVGDKMDLQRTEDPVKHGRDM
jgi:hypothetical protein